MEKKAYIKPELNVIMMTEQTNILAGSVSGGLTGAQFTDDEADEGMAWSSTQGSLWDDTEE